MSKKIRVPERQAFRIDHATCGEWFYNEIFRSREDAEAYIDDRNPKYRDKLTVVEYTEPEHDSWHLGSFKL